MTGESKSERVAAPQDSAQASTLRLSGTNLEHAGDHNQRVTLHAIRLLAPTTRSELADVTGLTSPAVANITKRLLDEGLIMTAGRSQGARGQPATRLVLNPESSYSIGLNIDRDHITMVAVDFEGRIRARASEEIDFALPAAVRAFVERRLPALLSDGAVPTERLVGMGVAVPDDLGSVDLPGRPFAYSEWKHVAVADLLSGTVDLPIFVENDAAAAAMGELQFGLGHFHSSFFYILISSALGGGLVVDGSYYRGASGRSGEIGFLKVRDRSGKDQELQAIVSVSHLIAMLEGEGVRLGSVHELSQLPDGAGSVIDGWIEESAQALVAPLKAVNCLINPGAVLIGGRLPSFLVDRLAARTSALLVDGCRDLPAVAPVARAALSEDAPAVGAAILPFSHFLLPRLGALMKTSEGDRGRGAMALAAE